MKDKSPNLTMSFIDASNNKFDLMIGFDELLVPGNLLVGGSKSNTDQVCYLKVLASDEFKGTEKDQWILGGMFVFSKYNTYFDMNSNPMKIGFKEKHRSVSRVYDTWILKESLVWEDWAYLITSVIIGLFILFASTLNCICMCIKR